MVSYRLDDSNLLIAMAILVSCLAALYGYVGSKLRYWERLGVSGPRLGPFGLLQYFTTRLNLFQLQLREYKAYGRVYGNYILTDPVLVVGEPRLLRQILVEDFNSFRNHVPMFFTNEITDRFIFSKTNDAWRMNRALLTPAFTSGKLKGLFYLFSKCADDFVAYLEATGQDIDVKEVSEKLSLDITGRCCFATNADVYATEESQFVKFAFSLTLPENISLFDALFARLKKVLGLATKESQSLSYFRKLIAHHVKQRKQNKEKQLDFLQLLLDAEVCSQDPNYSSRKCKIAEEDIPDQMLHFFYIGKRATVHLMKFALYHLAVNQDCQEKLFQEISKLQEMSYETISGLKYLEAFIFEILRLYPTVVTNRLCSEDYELSDTGIVVPRGMRVYIPIYALHMDAEFFPEPDTFLPDRFLPENNDKLVPFTYLPFGLGPRQCIALKFTLLEAKVALAKVISKLILKPVDRTNIPLVPLPAFRNTLDYNGLFVGAWKRSSSLSA